MSFTSQNSTDTTRSRPRKSYAINALEDAMRVLEAVSESGGQIRLSSLAEGLGLPKEKVFRILVTFEGVGYVEYLKDSGSYRLGLSAFALGQKFLAGMGLLREARPVMNTLARELNEAVYCVVPVGDEALFLDMVNTTERVAIMPLTGKRFSLEKVAAGRALKPASGPAPKAPKGSKAARQTAETLFPISMDEGVLGAGIHSFAVPVLQAGGATAGSLCLVVPEFRAEGEKIQTRLLPELRRAAETVSAKLGYLGRLSGGHF